MENFPKKNIDLQGLLNVIEMGKIKVKDHHINKLREKIRPYVEKDL